MYLNDLQFIPGSMKKRKRVARGNSGKATGKGLKGQKARSGVSLSNFQGGQTPLERRVPKHNTFFVKKTVVGLPLSRLIPLFESKIIDEKTVLTKDLLRKFKLIPAGFSYKLVGFIDRPLIIEASSASKGAIASIEANGGKLSVLERKNK